MLYRLIALLCLMTALAQPLWAQSLVPGATQPDTGSAETGGDAVPADPTQTLIEILRDDAAREALISRLEQAVPEQEGAATEDPGRTVGRQVAEITQGAAERAAEMLQGLVDRLRNLPMTVEDLSGAIDPDVVIDALTDLAFVIAATYASFILLRLLSRGISARLERRAKGVGWLQTLALSLLSSAIDVVVVALAWAAGYALTVAFSDGFGVIQIRQTLYLNAFLTVELAKVAGRAVLAPRFSDLRLVALSDFAAKRIWRWLNFMITLIGYGLLLAVPIVNLATGYIPGAALGLTISVLGILYTMYRVHAVRRPVAQWLHRDAPDPVEDDAPAVDRTPLLARLAGLWHVPLQGYLLTLLVLVLVRPGNVLLPLLQVSAWVVGIVLAGLVAADLLRRVARHGVVLPDYITSRLPLLQHRLNGLLPKILLVLRLAIVALVIAFSLDAMGLWDISAWFASDRGGAFLAAIVSATLVILVAIALWLALASWVEYRLNPLYGQAPTARVTTLLTLLRNAATIALMVLTLMFVLSELGLDIAPLLASAGVLGLAIGFGAQKMVQDIITGIFIQFENAINVGDVISVGGVTGTVEKLTVRSVSIRDLQGIFHIVPFSSVDLVSNYMRDFSFYVADIGVAYRENVDEVKQAMLDAFETLREDAEIRRKLLDDLQWLGLESFGDSAVVIRARIKTVPGEQWGIGRAYNAILKKIFDERGIEMPFPHQTIYFGEDHKGQAPPLRIRQQGG
ncbi:MAG: mechanosensitive ion channel domain-containing protein [Pseudomonadota bacterium]